MASRASSCRLALPWQQAFACLYIAVVCLVLFLQRDPTARHDGAQLSSGPLIEEKLDQHSSEKVHQLKKSPAQSSRDRAAPSPWNPKAHDESEVRAGHARFTVLTDSLIRLEWSASQRFSDQQTLAIVNRRLPKPQFQQRTDQETGELVISTAAVELHYQTRSNRSFSPANLWIKMKSAPGQPIWRPEGTWNASIQGRLPGTVRTLDGVGGMPELNCLKDVGPEMHCTLGLISQDGFVVVDDSNQGRMDDSAWPWIVNRSAEQPTQKQCSIAPHERVDCGRDGWDEGWCRANGCCFQKAGTDGNGQPGCYYSTVGYRDLYLFAHGLDYKRTMKEFTSVSGKIPLPPRFMFGIFYSRYWAFNDLGEKEIVQLYEDNSFPLDVLVIDMDWHLTFYANQTIDPAGEPKGWTGFTWDKHLFPNPKKFLQWLHDRGLKVTLNLHPASGIQVWEDTYQEFARAMGVDPASGRYIPFQIANKTFAENFFNITVGKRVEEGVDFWWLDWQQGEDWLNKRDHQFGTNPTLWLNYVFSTHPLMWNTSQPDLRLQKRPILMHRWGGLGNHRYPIGFSGDVQVSWDSLAAQPPFTASAANVGFGYWSHDLGGHTSPSAPELYVRWVQWGIFSPIFRTHCTKNAGNYRDFWRYPWPYSQTLREFVRLRFQLLPYIYTQARRTYDTGLSLVRGLYWEWPALAESYSHTSQYVFGDDLLVAPITQAAEDGTGLVSRTIWFPPGLWFDFFTGKRVSGPSTLSIDYTIKEMPGAVIPSQPEELLSAGRLGKAQQLPEVLRFTIFPYDGAEGQGNVYEDDGASMEYTAGGWAETTLTFSASQRRVRATLHPAQGDFKGQRKSRRYQIVLRSVWPPESVQVDGKSVPYAVETKDLDYKGSEATKDKDSWSYDGSLLSLELRLGVRSVQEELKVEFTFPDAHFSTPHTFPHSLSRMCEVKALMDDQWGVDTVYQDDYPALLTAAGAGQRITYEPSTARAEVRRYFEELLPKAQDEIKGLKALNGPIRGKALRLLVIPGSEDTLNPLEGPSHASLST